jgi:hypothetical protein
MANTIILKRSATPGKTPTTSQLELGEIAINTHDGRIFIKKDDGNPAVVEIGGVTSVNTHTGDVVLGTDDISEGSNNLYFTTARARAALSAGTGITYSSSTGVISTTQNLTTTGTPSFAGLTLTGNATARDIIPAADVTYALGSVTRQWKDLYVGPGTIYVNGSPVLSTSNGAVQLGGSSNQDVNLAATGTGTLTVGAATVTGDITLTSGKQIKDSANSKVLFANAIDMQSHKIINVTTPTATADAATKGYVDTAISAISTSAISKGDSNVTVTDTGTGTVTVTVDGSTALTVDSTGVTVAGNFTVSGTQTVVDSNTISLADNVITLNSDASGAPTQNAGIEVNRGSSTNVQLRWNEGISKWQFTNDGSVYTSFATNTDSLSEGSTNLYFTNGRARTALSATTATGITYNSSSGAFSLGSIPNSSLSNNAITINGASVALGGSRTLGTDDVSEGSTNLYFTTSRARSSVSATGTGLTYNSSTGVISSNATSLNTASTVVARDASGNFTAGTITAALAGNASTATALATPRTINGQSFDGTSNITFSTDNVSEGSSSKYYTDARVKSYLGGGSFDGNIIPATDNIYNLGSASKMWHSLYVGPGSLYINNQQVLSTTGNNIVVSADTNQNVSIQTSGTGNVEFAPTGTGTINMKGPIVVYTGNTITSSDGGKIQFGNQIGVDSLTSKSTNTDLVLTGQGTGIVKVDDDLTITGSLTVQGSLENLSATNLSITDNIIDINSAITSGTNTNNAGIRVFRGDATAVQLRWNESSSAWQYTNDGATYNAIAGVNATQTLTNKTISGSSNTLSNIGNSSLTNSAITINGQSVSLGGSTTVTAQAANALTIGTGLTGTSYNGSTAVTVAVDTSTIATKSYVDSQILTKDNTDEITEGSTNLYFTNARARGAVSAGTGISYSSSTGVISTSAIPNASLSNSSVTVGTTAISLGASSTTLAGLTSVTSTAFVGALTGNVTGNVTGTSGSTTGNAATATTLQTARAINGVSFDGSANVTTLTAGTGVTVSGTQVSIGQAVGTTSNVTFNDLTVSGNLTVSGTTTSIQTATLDVTDKNITVAKGAASAAAANGAGLTVEGPATQATFTYTSADDRWNLNKNLNVTTVYGSLSGNASTATSAAALTTARTIALTGDATASGSFDGSANYSQTLTLATVNSNVGQFGSATAIPVVTVNAKGLVTAISTTSVSIPSGALTFTGDVTGTGSTGSSTALSIATGAVTNAMLAGSIADSKLSTISTAGKVSNSATTATSANTASAIVARDGSGNFTAGTITAALTGNVTGNVTGTSGSTTGNAATATTLQTARAINGVSFNGSADVTVHTAGTGISISGTTVTNSGVTSIVAGTGISISGATGAVTVTNSITNNNQLTNGSGYITGITSANVTGALGFTPYNSTNPSGYITASSNTSGTHTGAVSTGSACSTGTLSVTGAITATGEVTAYYSDANLKKDIVEIQDPISKVMSLRGVTFRPNETALALGITDKEEVGVIAQEVEAVLPQLVTPSAFAGYKTVKYDKLTALLLEAVKAQQLQIDALRAEISKLGGSATTEL